MGLFINSHLQSLSTHKRLTELEKLSEISTGILALKAMVEGGGNLDNHQLALENLMRMLPMLSATQQKFVMEEIFAPLMAQQEPGELSEHIVEDDAAVEASHVERGASSDYEMEFQLKLNRQGYLDIKELNREQRNARHQKELERTSKEREEEQRERVEVMKTKVYQKLEASWAKINHDLPPKKLKNELTRFIYSFAGNLGRDHPLLSQAREQLKSLKR